MLINDWIKFEGCDDEFELYCDDLENNPSFYKRYEDVGFNEKIYDDDVVKYLGPKYEYEYDDDDWGKDD